LVFIMITAGILIADLERPERFFYILTRPNWRSWMVWGTCFLVAHGVIVGLWMGAGLMGFERVLPLLAGPALITSVLATSYTGFLFAQGLARDLWQGPHSSVDLLLQASLEGAAALLLLGVTTSASAGLTRALVGVLSASLVAHLLLLAFENLLTPSATRHHELATAAIRRGAYASLFWGGVMVAGGLLPLVLFGLSATPGLWMLGAGLAMSGAFAWEYVWVEAGQSAPLS
jgi:formate-dependent nitrite reductase membrane component NrfD